MVFPVVRTFDDTRRALAQLRAQAIKTFDPTWGAVSSAPAIGNGTIIARYWMEQYTCHYMIKLVAGSTTTFGTGAWSFTLPMSPRAEMDWMGVACYYNVGVRFYGGGVCRLYPDETLRLFSETAGAQSGFVGVGTPFAWGTDDTMWAKIAYPI